MQNTAHIPPDGRSTPRPAPSLLTPPSSTDRPVAPHDAFASALLLDAPGSPIHGPRAPPELAAAAAMTELRQPVAFSAAHENALEQLKRAMSEHNPDERDEKRRSSAPAIVASDPLSNPMNTTNIYINGLPPNFTEEQLYKIVGQFGNVLSVKTFTRAISDKPSGYGFALFERLEDAENCIKALRRSKDLHPSFSKQVHKIPARNVSPSTPPMPTPRMPQSAPPLRAQTSPSILTSMSPSLADLGGSHYIDIPAPDPLSLRPLSMAMSALPELSGPVDISIIGLPLHTDSGKALQALIAPQLILGSCFFQTTLAGSVRLVAFIRLESLDSAQEVINRLNGRSIRGLTGPLLVKLANLPRSTGARAQHVPPPTMPSFVDVTDALNQPSSRLRRFSSVPSLSYGGHGDDVEQLRRTLTNDFGFSDEHGPGENAFTVDPDRAPLRSPGAEDLHLPPHLKFSVADILRSPRTRIERLGRFTPGERVDQADAERATAGFSFNDRLPGSVRATMPFTPANSTNSNAFSPSQAPRLTAAEIAALQLQASPYLSRAPLQKRPSKAVPIRAPPPPVNERMNGEKVTADAMEQLAKAYNTANAAGIRSSSHAAESRAFPTSSPPTSISSGSPPSTKLMSPPGLPFFNAAPNSPEQLSVDRFPVLQPASLSSSTSSHSLSNSGYGFKPPKPYDYGSLFTQPGGPNPLLDFPDSPASSNSLDDDDDDDESAEDLEIQAAGARWLDSWLNEPDDAEKELQRPAVGWVGESGADEALEPASDDAGFAPSSTSSPPIAESATCTHA